MWQALTPIPGVGRRICWFEKGPILTILDANLTAVEMLFSCFVIRQTRVAQRTGTLTFRGLSDAAACYACSPLIVQDIDIAVFSTQPRKCRAPAEGRIFVAEMSQEF